MEQLTLSAMAAMPTHRNLDTVEQPMIMLISLLTPCAALAVVAQLMAQPTTQITTKLQPLAASMMKRLHKNASINGLKTSPTPQDHASSTARPSHILSMATRHTPTSSTMEVAATDQLMFGSTSAITIGTIFSSLQVPMHLTYKAEEENGTLRPVELIDSASVYQRTRLMASATKDALLEIDFENSV
jgi:hypothetical protein